MNAAVAAGVATMPTGGYSADWAVFDNLTNQTQTLGARTTGPVERIQAPTNLPAQDGSFVKVQVSAVRPANAAWTVAVDVYFRRVAGTWKLVGLERHR